MPDISASPVYDANSLAQTNPILFGVASRGATAFDVSTVTAAVPLLSIRAIAVLPRLPLRLQFTYVKVLPVGGIVVDAHLSLIQAPTIGGADAPTWVAVTPNTQRDIARVNTNTLTLGTLLWSGYISELAVTEYQEWLADKIPTVSLGVGENVILAIQHLASADADYLATLAFREV